MKGISVEESRRRSPHAIGWRSADTEGEMDRQSTTWPGTEMLGSSLGLDAHMQPRRCRLSNGLAAVPAAWTEWGSGTIAFDLIQAGLGGGVSESEPRFAGRFMPVCEGASDSKCQGVGPGVAGASAGLPTWISCVERIDADGDGPDALKAWPMLPGS